MKFFKNAKGAVSIFLVIILVPMMTVSSLFVDASRVKLSRAVADSAGNLALNTGLTDYDTVLKDLYGLFATSQSNDELLSKLEDYYRTSITSSGVSDEEASTYLDQIMGQLGMVAKGGNSDMLNMQLIDFNAKEVSGANLANASIMKNAIVDFMKYRAPINTGLGFLSSIKSFSTISKQTELVDKRKAYYETQQTVMKNCQDAWSQINSYNKSPFVSDGNYLTNMKTELGSYVGKYKTIHYKTVKDLFDTQGKTGFSPYEYQIVSETKKVYGQDKTVPVFYTNSAKTSRRTLFFEITTYSDANKATAANIKTALINFYTAYNSFKTAEGKIIKSTGAYGLQYVVQTNRNSIYINYVNSAAALYDKYSQMRHAVYFAGKDSQNKSVMETSEKLFGESSNQLYSYYYDKFCSNFDSWSGSFNSNHSNLKSTIQGYVNSGIANLIDITTTDSSIKTINNEITGYRKALVDANNALNGDGTTPGAIQYLKAVLDGIKPGGTLDSKKNEWNGVASDSALKNTSIAKQDLAELKNLGDQFKSDDVQKLIDRLTNVSSGLTNQINEIDKFLYKGTKITDIKDYQNSFKNVISVAVGASALQTVPVNLTALTQKADAWWSGAFAAGNVDVSWINQSGKQTDLRKDKLNFYVYLFTHFNNGTVDSGSTDTKTEDTTNGKDLFENVKSKASVAATAEANKTNNGSITGSNEINSQSNLPSQSKGSSASTPNGSVKTDNNSAKDTSGGLSSMFSNLSTAVMNMGTDLMDKLYIADYSMNMFSYDTIEKEFTDKNPGKALGIKTLTNTPINATNNFDYGREVEYIIYGGDNQSNLIKSYGSIYAIRLGFNLVYAFMDSSIRDGAFAIAVPISAATLGVIPAPLIQAAIIIGISVCESSLDINDLREGKSVPIFKDSKTWRLSFNGLMNVAKGVAGDLISTAGEYVIDEGSKKLSELLDKTDEEIAKLTAQEIGALTDAVGASYDTLITRHADMAIQKLTTLATNSIEEYALNPSIDKAKYVSDGLDSWLKDEAVGVNTGSDLGYIVKKAAVDIIKAEFIPQIIKSLEDSTKNVAASVANMGDDILSYISGIKDKINRQIIAAGGKVDQYRTQLVGNIHNSINEGAGKFKETLNEQLDGVFGNGNKTSDTTGIASLLSFRYSDYMRLFLMIGLYTNEEGIILRTADVIQTNVQKIPNGEGDKFLLSKSSVYLEITATIQVKPTLLALPIFADVKKNPKDNSNWYTITYKGIKGY